MDGDPDGWVAYRPGESMKLQLTFNPATMMFEGVDDDDYHVATPGKPHVKRSAVAVMVEAVERLLGE